ncbi:MraY family glycosyltransferase [Roseospira visakhapatnamensis]|uniref:UDP-N-acetylmuramyl pentapeptide phosphotransferase/UDP-N-acetylglucosamine-1-phosphate transferase n=1 Tax=Roseospira visakhapatnamensis TaxID=390880 RepID=A0A7W6R9V4_9PROT|nr:glycosyltransferase family 4 protein [Roseospira visakhapatnamensis]MBB4264611.1 UDP-N-acetylmuramyl pentapeptide phosphotransferase/UDP-N-acetylglucosamine-1-phosphate transferase [Roseospira visakhapatnamensis]
MILLAAPHPLILAALAAVLTVAGVRLAELWLRRRALLDHPNARSSHSVPTPRGGGLAVMAVAVPLLAWDAATRPATMGGGLPWALILGGVGLAVVSWWDDLRNLPARARLLAHVMACVAGLLLLPLPGPVFQGWLPGVLDPLAAVLAWAWFVNLVNFMDGIDGITGVETVTVGLALALLATVPAVGGLPVAAPLILAGAMAGFLVWNWHPARLFLGDVGSVPLGYLLGGLLVMLAASGAWAAALIAPAYYWGDATLTLLVRAARRRPLAQAHREHAYQRAVQAGLSHARVSTVIATVNAVLVGLALASALWTPWPPLAAAAVLVLATLALLHRPPRWLGGRTPAPASAPAPRG